jgi:catechol 2,3-dioxygenase-like lactoylglutathione lyase family enzyme
VGPQCRRKAPAGPSRYGPRTSKEVAVLRDYSLTASLATADAARARRWYADKLGLEPVFEDGGYLGYKVGPGMFTVYETPTAGTQQSTAANLNVRDLDAEMERLRARGVVFEDYDFGDFKTEGGVLRGEAGGGNAWFKDADGNILSLVSNPNDPRPPTVSAMLAAADLGRARDWYRHKLGFENPAEYAGDVLGYRSGEGWFEVYRTQFAGTAKNTVGAWNVKDLRAEMAALRDRGVVFEDYDFGEIKTVDGLMTDPGGGLNAWFTDSEGNILALVQYDRAG